MHTIKGFTLIELVIVIIILGILSATAIPKFVNLSRDARIAALNGIKGSLSSTSLLVEVKAKIENVETGSVEIEGNDVAVVNGYISGHWNDAWRYALHVGQDIEFTKISETCTKNAICGVGNQRSATGVSTTLTQSNVKGLVMLWFEGDKLSDLCFAFYYNPGDSEPTIGTVDIGC